MLRKILISVIICLPLFGMTQELMVQVNINTAQIEGTEKKVFQTLQSALYEFINDRKWTNYQYKPEERIEGSIMITIEKRISSDQFVGKLNIVMQRPIYKTSYNSNLLNIKDNNFEFKYVEFEPLNFNENSISSNLTAVMAYYIYMMLGFDADSYSPLGGTPYYEKARNIVNGAQNLPDKGKGWMPYESLKNRYWLVENMLNSSYSSLRNGIYSYHRQGLDMMTENIDIGRSGVSEFLEDLQKVNREKPGLYAVQILIDAKRDELINIYQQAAPMDKTKAINVLKEVDPANSSRYQQIMVNK